MRWGDPGAPSLRGYLRVWTRRVGRLNCSIVLGPTRSCRQRGCSKSWTPCEAPAEPSAMRTAATALHPRCPPGAQRLSSGVTVGAVRQCVTSTRVHGHPVPKVGGPRVTSRPIQRLQNTPFAGQPPLQLLPVCRLSIIHASISIYGIPDKRVMIVKEYTHLGIFLNVLYCSEVTPAHILMFFFPIFSVHIS